MLKKRVKEFSSLRRVSRSAWRSAIGLASGRIKVRFRRHLEYSIDGVRVGIAIGSRTRNGAHGQYFLVDEAGDLEPR